MKTSRKIKTKFNTVSYLLVHATQHFPAVGKDIVGRPCAICNNLDTWKQFLNSLTHQTEARNIWARWWRASDYLKRRVMLQHDYWKKDKKATNYIWMLVYFVSIIFVAMKVCYQLLLDFKQEVREHFMKAQWVRVRTNVKNHCSKPKQIQTDRQWAVQFSLRSSHSLQGRTQGGLVGVETRAVESEVSPSDSNADSDSGQFRLSDSNSDSGPTPTFSCISFL